MGKIIKREIRSNNAARGLVDAVIKPIDPSDINLIIQIARQSFETVWKLDEFLFFISNPNAWCWGAWFEKELIGYFLGLLVQGELDIVSVAVANQWRRCGAGQVLIEVASSSGIIGEMFLEVEADNEKAISLYTKCGFEKYGLRRKYYNGLKDAVLMKKKNN